MSGTEVILAVLAAVALAVAVVALALGWRLRGEVAALRAAAPEAMEEARRAAGVAAEAVAAAEGARGAAAEAGEESRRGVAVAEHATEAARAAVDLASGAVREARGAADDAGRALVIAETEFHGRMGVPRVTSWWPNVVHGVHWLYCNVRNMGGMPCTLTGLSAVLEGDGGDAGTAPRAPDEPVSLAPGQTEKVRFAVHLADAAGWDPGRDGAFRLVGEIADANGVRPVEMRPPAADGGGPATPRTGGGDSTHA
jgi:hypothetical protein